MRKLWNHLYPKVRVPLAAAVAADGASAIASLNGTVQWHVTLAAVAASLLALVVGYLTPAGTKS